MTLAIIRPQEEDELMAKKQPQTVQQELLKAFYVASESGDVDAMREVNSQMKLLYEQTGEMSSFLMYAATKAAYSEVESIETFEQFIKLNSYYNVQVSEPDNILFFSCYAFHLQRYWDDLPTETQDQLPAPLPIVELIITAQKEQFGKINELAFVLFENHQDDQLLNLINNHKFKAKEEYLFFKLCLAAVNSDAEKMNKYFFRLAKIYNCAVISKPNKRNIFAAINRFMVRYNTNVAPDIPPTMVNSNVKKPYSKQSRHYDVCDILVSFFMEKLTIAPNEAIQSPIPPFDEALSQLLNERSGLFRELAK
jgi:hypothetical protein